jgi:hypothetical protein
LWSSPARASASDLQCCVEERTYVRRVRQGKGDGSVHGERSSLDCRPCPASNQARSSAPSLGKCSRLLLLIRDEHSRQSHAPPDPVPRLCRPSVHPIISCGPSRPPPPPLRCRPGRCQRQGIVPITTKAVGECGAARS